MREVKFYKLGKENKKKGGSLESGKTGIFAPFKEKKEAAWIWTLVLYLPTLLVFP